jgi:glucan phosphoethanolaminetransferase (alkaline phosphatase superfamily)
MVKRVIFTLQRRSWTAVSALIALLMLPNLIWLCVGQGLAWVSGLIIPTLLLTFVFALFGKKIWLACLLLAPFAALAPAEAFYIATYKHPTSAQILASLGATNPRETYEYFSSALLPIMLCISTGLSLALLAARWSWRSGIRWQHATRNWILAIYLMVPLVSMLIFFAINAKSPKTRVAHGELVVNDLYQLFEPGYPFGLTARIVQYHVEWAKMRREAAQVNAFDFHAHRVASTSKRQIYVLVIGESSRRDHWQLFGYQRETNPKLTHVSNLVTIPDMVTSWPLTLGAVPLILTRKPPADFEQFWKEASVLRAMQEGGFDTYWISNQYPVGFYDSAIAIYAYQANHVSFHNYASVITPGGYDDDLLQPLRNALKESPGDLFIVLHMMGSHDDYDFRYPSTFKYFQPAMTDPGKDGSSYDRTGNSYDNTIRYTDYVLSSVIDTLRGSGTTAAMLYESDHGEDLATPDCKLSGHGNGSIYDYQIPAFFWYSDEYARAFPERVAAFRSNASQPVLSADTFASLIDMVGISIPDQDSTRSLFNTKWRYRPRTINVPDVWQTDLDKSTLSKQCKVVLPSKGNYTPIP